MKKKADIIKRIIVLFGVTAMLFCGVFIMNDMTTLASETTSDEKTDIEALLSDVEEKVSEALSEIDEEKAGEIFDFVKEKVADGSLESQEGIKEAIAEGEARFGVTIDESMAEQVVEVMEKLEDMGFSGEEIVNKAKNLYDTYGADFLSHANEAFTQVVEEAVENAVTSFFSNLWEDIKTSVGNLFKSWF